jgi:hypothetical protein
MTADPGPPDARQLEIHLANDVHWLVYAAVRFSYIRDRNTGVVFQNSAFVNARSLLEFTKPWNPHFGWSMHDDFGGIEPSMSAQFADWNDFINAKVAHLGDGRLDDISWPLPEADQDECRLILLAQFCLGRIVEFAPDAADPYGEVIRRIAKLGLDYLDGPESLAALETLMVT